MQVSSFSSDVIAGSHGFFFPLTQSISLRDTDAEREIGQTSTTAAITTNMSRRFEEKQRNHQGKVHHRNLLAIKSMRECSKSTELSFFEEHGLVSSYLVTSHNFDIPSLAEISFSTCTDAKVLYEL